MRSAELSKADGEARPSRSAPSTQSFTGIDTHTHVFRHDAEMVNVRRYTPTYAATIADYLAMLDANGVSHGVLVQISILGTDNSYLLEALGQEPGRLRGIAVLSPDTRTETLRSLNQVGVVGVRLNLIGLPDPDLASTEWQQHLSHVAELGWQVEVQAEARRLPSVLPPLLGAGVRVVVDHFGRPDHASGVDDPGFRYLLATARTRRVWVKLSGPYRNGWATEGDQVAAAAAGILLCEFGSDRLMWGSDWPHTCFEQPGQTGATQRALHSWIPSEVDRRAVLVETPRVLFRFGAEDGFPSRNGEP